MLSFSFCAVCNTMNLRKGNRAFGVKLAVADEIIFPIFYTFDAVKNIVTVFSGEQNDIAFF